MTRMVIAVSPSLLYVSINEFYGIFHIFLSFIRGYSELEQEINMYSLLAEY
jgi:hypothetical protein